jgi:hypothetical protein
MTSQEKELLARFLNELAAARAQQKDPEADALIREAAARQPDAAYLLVQRSLQLEQLLDAAEARVQTLQAELDRDRQPASGGSFLSDNAWGSRPGTAQPEALQRTPIPGTGGGAQPAPQSQPQAQAMPPMGARPSWGGGMLGTVAGTAAGVVAGSFLFQGIQNLMHHGDNNLASAHSPDHHSLLGDDSRYTALPSDPSDLSDLSGLSQLSDDDADTFADGGGDDSGDFA